MIGRVGAFAALALAIVSRGSTAQEATGRVEGWVLAPDSQPAASVRITASGPSLQGRRDVEADTRGYFRLIALPVGTYQVRLALIGYRPVLVNSVEVDLGRTTSLGEITLQSQTLELGEIVVSAERPLLDLASAAAATNIPSERFRTLPTGRNFRSIISLAPEAVHTGLPGDEVNISGGTGPENAYYLDGVNITDPLTAATSADLPYNFIKELEVKEGGYEAEYGRATGGIVNIITYSGGNQFGGNAFGFYTNDGLTAEPRFANPTALEPSFSVYDVGGSLGGPILRDRLWFFAAYDPSVFRHGADVVGLALPDDRQTQHLFAGKLTWQAGPRTDVMLAVHGDPLVHHVSDVNGAATVLVNPDPLLYVVHQGGLVLTGLVRRRLGRSTQGELSVARFTRQDHTEGATELGRTAPHYVDNPADILSGGVGNSESNNSRRTAVHASMSAAQGSHTFKVGLEYEDNKLDNDTDFSAQPGSPGGFIVRLDDTTYVWFRAHFRSSVHNRVPSAYVQDAWRLGSRVILNAGIRWDGQYFIGPAGDVMQSFTDQWQPRLGLVYAPGRPGSQKLYGSFARFYEQVPLALPNGYYNPQPPALRLSYTHDPRSDPRGADTTVLGPGVAEPSHNLKGQSLDEFRLGYDRAIGSRVRVGLRGVYRRLRWAVEDASDSAGNFEVGNPGRGDLAFLPRAKRTYAALIFTVEQPPGGRFDFLASYVLSRSYGNYAGLYDYWANGAGPNQSLQFDLPGMVPNSTGLLPNDRRHVLKFSGAYRFDFGLTVGTVLAWMSGTPRNDYVGLPAPGALAFLQPRGSVGRTDAVCDGNLRFTYRPTPWSVGGPRPTLFLDLSEIGNRRSALIQDDVHYAQFDDAGNPILPNPHYGKPLEFQPPMSARLGLSVGFGAEP
jgi:carboxypeptidase family protein/TonB-dependent receptor-like protein